VARSRLSALCMLYLALAVVAGCASAQRSPVPESAHYWPTDGWRTSTPEQQGMSSEKLAKMLEAIELRKYAIDSVTVIRNGYIVTDAYVHPFGPGSRHVVHSCTKSINSALMGIAIEKGYIGGVGQKVTELFPEHPFANLDARKQAMTLEHLLTMTSGLDCQDSHLYSWQGLQQMRRTDNWAQYVLDLPMREQPGTRFEYCNGASYLLSAIVQKGSGLTALDFAREHLFGPLGIVDVHWPSSPEGISIGWGDLEMRPHDMAKIGYLYLHMGMWDGRQVVPAEWVEASTRKHINATLSDGYGYQWWVDASGYYMALGWAGQYIVVVPDKNLVVVFTSDLSESDFFLPERLMNQHIIPAAESVAPLPPNPDRAALLQSQIQDLAKP